MKFDARLGIEEDEWRNTRAIAELAESLGLSCLWTGENKHDAFLPLAVAAEGTSRIRLGTAVAIAFSRSPMVVAQLAWDLQRRSEGRFMLGLGTQVRAHVTRRFSMPWSEPATRLAEYVEAVRAVWHAFQNGSKLDFQGRFYQHTLMAPAFNPGPIAHPEIPVSVSGVGPASARVAGRYADGYHVHPFHSREYVEQVVRPQLSVGAESSGRALSDIELSTSVFAITGFTTEETDARRHRVRSRIAFYASTPSYRPVLEIHGWEGIGARLGAMARDGRWDDMPSLVSDDMLDAFAVEAAPDALAATLEDRYEGLIERVALFEFLVPSNAELWRVMLEREA